QPSSLLPALTNVIPPAPTEQASLSGLFQRRKEDGVSADERHIERGSGAACSQDRL
ncbi:hypothetical protein GBF38_009297, partial [Nibea albiflora]